MTTKRPFQWFLVASVATWASVAIAAPPREVLITSPRIRVGDLLANAGDAAAAVDVGPSPAAGASKLVTRADMLSALEANRVTALRPLPESVRVVRKVRHLTSSDFDVLARQAILTRPLGKGVSLLSVHVDHLVDVADGWTRVDMDIPRAPKKMGTFRTTAIASFYAESEIVARIVVPLELTVTAEGASYDVLRNSPVGLVLRRGCVEVRTTGFAGVDADVGDRLPVQIRPSGRVLRSRLVSKDEAVVLEDGE
jgi:hypothetical protein